MDSIKNLRALCGFILILVVCGMARAESDISAEVNQGLDLLFQEVPAETNRAQNLAAALAFERQFSRLTESSQPPLVSWSRVDLLTRKFTFRSQVQRPGHPANEVHGYLYEPLLPKNCEVSLPATLILHHIADDIKPEQMMASMMASGRAGVTMIIVLPHFGVRRGAENFITNSPADFEINLLQSMTDIHQAGLILKSLGPLKSKRLQLMGISLGGILTLMSAGLDPLFDRFISLVGGGDLANILSYNFESSPDSEVSMALKGIHWNAAGARDFLSRLDPITWAYHTKGKHILMLNAESDELLDRELSVNKLAKAYRESGNEVKTIWHPGPHRPAFSIKTILSSVTKVAWPMIKFMTDNQDSQIQDCQAR